MALKMMLLRDFANEGVQMWLVSGVYMVVSTGEKGDQSWGKEGVSGRD